MKPRTSAAVLALACLVAAQPAWAGRQAAASAALSNAAAGHAGGAVSVIQGTAVYSDRSPVPYARVRLRNLANGQVEQMATADYAGDFSFLANPGTSYIVEVVDDAGRVLAAGNMLAAEVGQTAGTLVVLPTRVAALAGLFGNTAAAVVSAAAATGVTAVAATTPPQSPEQ
jgi:hypothetical protein